MAAGGSCSGGRAPCPSWPSAPRPRAEARAAAAAESWWGGPAGSCLRGVDVARTPRDAAQRHEEREREDDERVEDVERAHDAGHVDEHVLQLDEDHETDADATGLLVGAEEADDGDQQRDDLEDV